MPSRKRIDGVSSRVWLIHSRGGALPSKGNTIWYVLFYGVVSAQTEKVVEFFLEREAAEVMIGEIREDEPELAEALPVERIELARYLDGLQGRAQLDSAGPN